MKTKRQEALELAKKARSDLFEDKQISSILLSCKSICKYLRTSEQNNWIELELNGYPRTCKTREDLKKNIPTYRQVGWIFFDQHNRPIQLPYTIQEAAGFEPLTESVSEIESCKNDGMFVHGSNILDALNDFIKKHDPSSYDHGLRIIRAHISTNYITKTLSGIKNRVHSFLDDVILELEYGQIPEVIFENIRNEADSRLSELCPQAIEKLPILYEQLGSNNPVVYSQIASTCRRIIKDVSDSLFPTQNNVLTDDKSIKLDDAAYLNRILIGIKNNIESKSEKELFLSTFSYVESFLRNINKFASKGDHSVFSKNDATRCIVYTYLILGDILHYYVDIKKLK